MQLLDAVPSPPDWLPNGHAVREWERLAPMLHCQHLLTEASLSPLGILCGLHGKIVQLYNAGELPNGALIAQYRLLANDFALTPASQAKLPTPGLHKGEDNPFAVHCKHKH